MSPYPGERIVLRDAKRSVGDEGCCVESSTDWARGVRGCLTWGIPAALLLASAGIGQGYLVVIWPILLTFMGVACLLNARRCGRIHCYITGPYFLLLAGLSLLYGLGLLPLGPHGWSTISAALVIGGTALICIPEWLFGRYRGLR